MQSLSQPKLIKVYCLLRQAGLAFSTTGSSTTGMGLGFYLTQTEAEYGRTMCILSDQSNNSGGVTNLYHIFELEVPNPAYKE
jgi:hypothetical protein